MALRKTFAVMFACLFVLLAFNDYVSAETVEEERIFKIDASDLVNYTAVFNIVNASNNQYSNYNVLVEPFIENSSISGGYSGSLLPPARFQLSGGESSSTNNKLVLASFVEFNEKNLLSGSSISWWRVPYYYNHSIAGSRNWDLTLRIFHVDMPRHVNLSFEYAVAGQNYPVYPTDEAHPSLIFERTYNNCGNTRNDQVYYMDIDKTMPANDTLVDPDKPLNLTAGPNYNPYKYNVTLSYSHAWVNVTAPIYPNESYMAIWTIYDADMRANDSASCWITSTDIGANDYGRSLISWNSRDIYELPIDLDTSVIFVYGLGDGVSGAKLFYNDPQYQNHNTAFTNLDFETKTNYLRRTFADSFASEGWSAWTTSSSDAYVVWDSITETAKFYHNSTIIASAGITNTAGLSSEGETIKIDVSLRYYSYTTTSSNVAYVSGFGIYTSDSSNLHSNIFIYARKLITSSGVYFDNLLVYSDSSGGTTITQLPDILPSNMYITLQNGIGRSLLYIYDKLDPRTPIATYNLLTDTATTATGYNVTLRSRIFTGDGIKLTSAMLAGSGASVDVLIAEVHDIALIERTNNFGGWSVIGSDTGVSKEEFYEGFETTPPEYDITTSSVAFSFKAHSLFTHEQLISQTQAVSISGDRYVFFKGYYRLVQSNLSGGYGDSFIRFQLTGVGGASGKVVSIAYGSAWDSSWHQISVNIRGDFARLYLNISSHFEGTFPFMNMRQMYVDQIGIESINIAGTNYHRFYKQLDKTDWNSTNYLSFMLPFKQSVEPDYPPICKLYFKNSMGATVYTWMTGPTDFYHDFIMVSIKTSNIPSTAEYVMFSLTNFGQESYLFLFDKNNDFDHNNKTDYKFNYFWLYDGSSVVDDIFISPYYSLETTEGEWSNADSVFTTTYFYFVVVHFVEFKDGDPEVIKIVFDNVAVQDFAVYRFNMRSFGEVYTAEEWMTYLEIRSDPSFTDRIIDAFSDFAKWLADSSIGQFFGAIGKFIYEALKFLAPILESLVNYLILIAQMFIPVLVYIVATWAMWKFMMVWTLIGSGRTEDGIMLASESANRAISRIKSTVKAGVSMIGKIASGGAG